MRIRGGQALVTDGPFVEAKEVIAGYVVIECADLDEAIAVAAKHPMARFGRIEPTLIPITGDWSLAEDCTAEPFEVALVKWQREGVPRNPARG